MKKYIYIILSSILAVSCVDTALPPYDRTVDDDFWKTKSDVSLMVNGAYAQMLSSSLLTDLIVWGDFRSDELVQSSGILSGSVYEALRQIGTANIETTNTYTNWQPFYSVINYCNIVIMKAADVMGVDPNYTEGDYLNDIAQMKTLRALCYFYLVRNFRDIPYITTGYMQNSQEMNVAQTAPETILNACIADLKEAATNIIDPTAYSDWKSKGWLNRDAVYALLADIYLWKASVHHNDANYDATADYQQSIYYCDLVIDSKNSAHRYGAMEIIDENNLYPAMAKYGSDYNDLFITQNGEESIFELQYDGANNSNSAVCTMLYKYGGNSSNYGYLKAPQMFGVSGTSNSVFPQQYDGRKIKFLFYANSSEALEQYDIRKMIVNNSFSYGAPTGVGQNRQSDRSYSRFAQNYIIYRMTDVMLMKAEAMGQLASGDDDIMLRQAFNIVKAVNDRAHPEGLYSDTLRFTTSKSVQGTAINTKAGFEELVLEERLRELCFEGKRWYDLLRYNYRHTEGVNYNALLADQGGNYPVNYRPMLTLMARKIESPDGLISKMPTEPYLYMPIREGEMEVNPELKQNPVYSSSDKWEKNY
ncbi:MAG: RagB/SusD family nutrient uptake outer membrane protein [Bacteroidaceae bacterium]|nr:RagB/SusD family nutrient uptake outer membrane protein [Bacteroidaceae bacterium]